MTSLAKCLEQIKDLSSTEKNRIALAAKEYREKGYSEKEAEISAVNDALKDLDKQEAEITGKVSNVQKEAPTEAVAAPKEEGKATPGRAWIKDQWRPFTEWRELTRGRNKGKIEIVSRGSKVIVSKDQVKEWPTAEKAPVKEAERQATVEDNLDLASLGKLDRIAKLRERFPNLSPSDAIRLSKQIEEEYTGTKGEAPKGSKFIEPKKNVLTVGGTPIGPSEARYLKRTAKEKEAERKVEEKVEVKETAKGPVEKGELKVEFENAAGYPPLFGSIRLSMKTYPTSSRKRLIGNVIMLKVLTRILALRGIMSFGMA